MRPERFIIQVLGWGVGLPLEVLIIAALLQGPYRRYPIVLFYLLVNLVGTLIEIPVNTQYFLTQSPTIARQAAKAYWINEWILQVLIFATVLSLLDLATSLARSRRLLRTAMAIGAVLFALITFWVHYLPPPVKFGVWMTPWTRDLSLGATVLDLALWMILIATPRTDRTLMLICGALGMQFTAETIGEAIVTLSVSSQSKPLALAGGMVAVAGNLLCLYVWWRTFRTERAAVAAAPIMK